jgi:hypothetical protein
MEDAMSSRSPEDTRENDTQDKKLHAVPEVLGEAHASKETTIPTDKKASTDEAKKVEFVETTVELDRVAAYLKGPTAFSA